jgi:hypothetical protein
MYIHIFPKKKTGLTRVLPFFFGFRFSESVLLGVGSPPDEFEGEGGA